MWDILSDVVSDAVGDTMEGKGSGNNMAVREYYFLDECPIPQEVGAYLMPNEKPITAYKTMRDSAVFTDRRLIIEDKQGITGKKIEHLSVPYSTIHMWATETAGSLDFTAELKLYTKSGEIKINLGKDVDVVNLDRLIAQVVVG